MVRWSHLRWLRAPASLLVLVLFVLALRILQPLPARATANTWFVKPNGAGNTCSQGTPCTLATALSKAQNGDSIYLASGNYTGSDPAVARIAKSLTLRGGWNGAASGTPVFDTAAFLSTLNGQNVRRVIEVTAGTTVVLRGIYVTGGKRADEGAGIFAQDANLTLEDTQVYANTLRPSSGAVAHGAGMAVRRGSLQIYTSYIAGNGVACSNCLSMGGGLYLEDPVTATLSTANFARNDALTGAGMCVSNSGVHDVDAVPLFIEGSWFADNGKGHSGAGVQLCERGGGLALNRVDAHISAGGFADNEARIQGGGLDATGRLTMDRGALDGNQAPTGAAFAFAAAGQYTVTNCFIADNVPTAPGGGAAVLLGVDSEGWLQHNTIVRNTSATPYYGITVLGNTDLYLINNIIGAHRVGVMAEAHSFVRSTGTLCGTGIWGNESDFQGSGLVERSDVEPHADPRFVAPDTDDWHLRPDSPAIDAGVTTTVDHDWDGDPRPMGSGYDIGADECSSTGPGPSPTPTATRTPAAPPAGGGLYFCDANTAPGEIRHYNPLTGSEELVYRLPSGSITSFSLTSFPARLYYVNWGDTRIYATSYANGTWQPGQIVYTHSVCVRDLDVQIGPDGQPVIYFSEASGSVGGKIYRYAQGAASLLFEVRQQDVPGWWGNFCLGEGGDIYVSQGQVDGAGLFRVRSGRVERIYTAPLWIMALDYTPGAIYYADYGQHLYRLDLATGTRTLAYTSEHFAYLSGVQWFGRLVYLPVLRRRS